jgi:general secretion pathway protein A
MFLEHFRLREQPFGVTPDPRYLFSSLGHREALASLIYGIESNLGFGSLIAEPGMGKTTLLFHILERYRQSARTAFIFNTQCNSFDLLQSFLTELDEQQVPRDTFQLHERVKQILAREAPAGRRVLLVIDEAQNLSDMVMETVRLLSNFESANAKLLHIVLAGQPELAARLSRPELSQLLQRIPIINTLPFLSPVETTSYIDHRLQFAGCQGRSLFAREPLARIAALSRGVPREINRICFNCLSLAYASGKDVVDSAIIREVAADLGLEQHRGQTEEVQPQPGAKTSEPPRTVVQAAAATSAALERRELLEASGRRETATTARTTSSAVRSSLPNQRPQGIRPGQHFTSTGAAKARKSKPLGYHRPPRWRPFAIAVIYLSLAAGAWTSATRWIYPNLVARQPSVTHATRGNGNPVSRPANREPSISVNEQPRLIRFVKPEYPKSARDRHIQGKVVLNAIVGGDGRVKAVARLKGDPTLLKAAETAVRGWIYQPYQVNGKHVDINQAIAISFSLPENQQ